MSPAVQPFSLPDFVVTMLDTRTSPWILAAPATAPSATCPTCGHPSARVHSR